MTRMDDRARTELANIQAAVHDLRDYTHDLEFVTTATTIAAGLTTMLGRLANIAENIAEQLRHLEGHAAGGPDAQFVVEVAALACQEIRDRLKRLQEDTHDPLARAYSVISHRELPAVTR